MKSAYYDTINYNTILPIFKLNTNLHDNKYDNYNKIDSEYCNKYIIWSLIPHSWFQLELGVMPTHWWIFWPKIPPQPGNFLYLVISALLIAAFLCVSLSWYEAKISDMIAEQLRRNTYLIEYSHKLHKRFDISFFSSYCFDVRFDSLQEGIQRLQGFANLFNIHKYYQLS